MSVLVSVVGECVGKNDCLFCSASTHSVVVGSLLLVMVMVSVLVMMITNLKKGVG